jgi:hypothetical protein
MVDNVYHMVFSLTEAARILRSAQHRLIHLCEKGVVVPDREARGRGTSRKFSKRNLLDFAVALEMRRLELPVSFTRAVLQVLRWFESEAKSIRDGFAIPDSLVGHGAPRLVLTIVDGERLYFSLTAGRHPARVFGGVSIRRPAVRGRGRHYRDIGRLQSAVAEEALATARTRVDVDLSRIAQDLEDSLGRA